MDFKAVKNVIYNWMGMAAAIVYAFIFTPFIVHTLGSSHYGIWNLVMSCVGYMAVLDAGIQSAVNRYVARSRGLNDLNGVSAIYSTAISIYLCIGLIATVLGVIVASNIETFFNIPAADKTVARDVMFIMVAYAAVEFPCNVFGAVIYAYQRFDALNFINVAGYLLLATMVWAALTYSPGLLTYALAVVACGLMKFVAQYVVCKRLVGNLRFSAKLISRSTVKELMAFSSITFLAIIANYMVFKTDNIVIGAFLSADAVAVYAIGFMLSDYIAQIVGKMCNILTPMFSEYEALDATERMHSLLFTSSRFSAVIGFSGGCALILLGEQFLSLWIGKEYEGAYQVAVLMMVARMSGFPTAPFYSMLYGIGKHHLVLYTGIGEAILNLGLSLALVRSYGLVGVAVGTMVPMLLGNLIFAGMVSRVSGFGFWNWIARSMGRPILMGVLLYGASYPITRLALDPTWAWLFIQGMYMFAVFVLLFWFVGLKPGEARAVREKIGALRLAGSGSVQ
jgi:O-antigen/teichoic acid export membrane protein